MPTKGMNRKEALILNEVVGFHENVTHVFGWAIGDPHLHIRAGFRHMLPLHVRVSARVHRVSFLHPSLDQELTNRKLRQETGRHAKIDVAGDISKMVEDERYRLSRDGIIANHLKRKRTGGDKKKHGASPNDEENKKQPIAPKGTRRLIVMSSQPPPPEKKRKLNQNLIKFEQLSDDQQPRVKIYPREESKWRKKCVSRQVSAKFETEEIAGTGTEFAAFLKVATTPEISGGGRFLPEVACRVPQSSICFEMRCRHSNMVKSTQPFVVEAPHVIWGGAKDKRFRSVADDGNPLIDVRKLDYLTNSELKQTEKTESLLIRGTTVYVDFPPDEIPEGYTAKGTAEAFKKGTVKATKKTKDFTKAVGKMAGHAAHLVHFEKKGAKDSDKNKETEERNAGSAASHDDIDGEDGSVVSELSTQGEGTKMAYFEETRDIIKDRTSEAMTEMYENSLGIKQKTSDVVDKLRGKLAPTFNPKNDKLGKVDDSRNENNVSQNEMEEDAGSTTNNGNAQDPQSSTSSLEYTIDDEHHNIVTSVTDLDDDAGSAMNYESTLEQQSYTSILKDTSTENDNNVVKSVTAPDNPDDPREEIDASIRRSMGDRAENPKTMDVPSTISSPRKHKKTNLFKKATKALFSHGHKHKNKKKDASKSSLDADNQSVASAPPVMTSSNSDRADEEQTIKQSSMPVVAEGASDPEPSLVHADSWNEIGSGTDASLEGFHPSVNTSLAVSATEPSGRFKKKFTPKPELNKINDVAKVAFKGTKKAAKAGAKNIKEGAKKFDEKLDEMEKKYREGEKVEEEVKLPKPKPYTLVLDDVIDFCVVGFPTEETLAKFPISVASILNARSMEDRQNNPLQPSELTVTLVKEPSTASGQYGVEAVVTFRVAEVSPRTTLAIEEPERDEEGKKMSNKAKLKRMKVRMQNIGKTRDQINEMVKAEEMRLEAEAEAREKAIVEAGIGKGYEQGASRFDIFQRQMFYDPEIQPHYSGQTRRYNRIKMNAGNLRLRANARSFLSDLKLEEMETLSNASSVSADTSKEQPSSLSLEAPSSRASKYATSLPSLEDGKDLDSQTKGVAKKISSTAEIESFSLGGKKGWSIEGSAEPNPMAPTRGNLKSLQMRSMWKSITDSEYKKMVLLSSDVNDEETSSVPSKKSDEEMSLEGEDLSVESQSSNILATFEPSTGQLQYVPIEMSVPSQPETLQSLLHSLVERNGGAEAQLTKETLPRDVSKPTMIPSSLPSSNPPSASSEIDTLQKEPRFLLNGVSDVNASLSTKVPLEARSLRQTISSVRENKQKRQSALPALMNSVSKRQSSLIHDKFKNVKDRNKLPSRKKPQKDMGEFDTTFRSSELGNPDHSTKPYGVASSDEERLRALMKERDEGKRIFMLVVPLLIGLLLGYFSRILF